jgi:hypothetical protein
LPDAGNDFLNYLTVTVYFPVIREKSSGDSGRRANQRFPGFSNATGLTYPNVSGNQ